jgi:Rieske Fe-S protein
MTTRRSALASAAASLLAVAVAACDAAVARLRGWRLTPVADVARVPEGGAYRTSVGDRPLILVNERGTVRTFVAECTHEGCPLGWNPTQRLIRCPCHGSAFDTAGRVVQGPARRALTELETVVERGTVMLIER